MKPYPEYKATGLQWLPQIPRHWELRRAKHLYKKANRPVAESDDVVTCFRDGVVTLRKKRRTRGFTESLKEIGYQGIRKGDLVIHVMDAFAGAIGVSDSDGKGTPVYNVCIPKLDINNYYYAYIVREMARRGYIQSLYRGIRERSSDFRFEVFAAQVLPLPPPDEQTQIVRYLDAMTAKINKLIRAKKKQIALLQEQKQAIINQAVTQGLDPNVEMKDSGIDWLGKIPKHWKIRPLKFYANSNQKSLSGTMDENFSFRYLEISSVGFGFIKKEPETFFFKAAPSRARRIVQQGDTIISTVRTYLRSMCFIDESIADCIVSTGFSVLTPKKEVLPVLLSYELNTDYFVNEVIRNSIGISYPAISDSKLLSLKLALPDTLEEQKEIFRHIKQKTSDIDQEIEQLGKTINKINEYKNSLVSAVVTGKMDIRGLTVEDVVPVAEDVTIDDEEAGEDVEEEMTEVESED